MKQLWGDDHSWRPVIVTGYFYIYGEAQLVTTMDRRTGGGGVMGLYSTKKFLF